MQIFKVTILNKNGNTYIRFDDFSTVIPYLKYKIPKQFHKHETQVYLTIPTVWIRDNWEFKLRN